MSSRDEDFTQVLARLHAVRDELRTTTSPERVGVLRSLADELVADGERLLGVHLGTPVEDVTPAVAQPDQTPADRPVEAPADAPVVGADDDGARRPEPTRPVAELERPS